MQVFGDDLDDAVIGRVASTSARLVRMPIQWPYIEPVDASPPVYAWSGLDGVVARLSRAGLVPLAVLYGRPPWAATTACGLVDKVPLARYAAYVGALVERYDGDGHLDAPAAATIRHWEIENEPDFDRSHAGGANDHGSCFGGAAADYGRLLRAAYLAAKAADPGATVYFGGVAYERFHNKAGYSPTGPFDHAFTGDTLAWLHANHGDEAGWPFFDRAAVHVYNDYRNNWDGVGTYRQELRAKLAHFRAHQLFVEGAFDLRGVPIAITEASIPSLPGDAYTARSEALQAAYPGQLVARAMAERVPVVAWFIAEDRFAGPCGSPYDWITVGLLRSRAVFEAARACGEDNPIPSYHVADDHEPKPAYAAFTVAQAQLGGTIFDTALDAARTGSGQIEAYRVYAPGAGYRIVAFTDNGERLGRVGSPPITRLMAASAALLPDWTGAVRVTDHLGRVSMHTGSVVPIVVGQEPVYIEAD